MNESANFNMPALLPSGHEKMMRATGLIVPLKFGDSFMRVLLSPNGARVFANDGSGIWILNTSDDSLVEALQATLSETGNEDAAISADGSVVLTSSLLTDSNLNVSGDLAYVDRDVWLSVAVYGQKLNSNGSLAFQPLTNGIDVLDGLTGLLQYRVALPIQLPSVYDALAIDDKDGLLFVLTANGIAQVNLGSLPPRPASRHLRAAMMARKPEGNAGKRPPVSTASRAKGRCSQANWLARRARSSRSAGTTSVSRVRVHPSGTM